MATSTSPVTQPTNGAARGVERTAPAAFMPEPPRAKRRWGVFAGMLLLVALGALGNVWLLSATTNAQEVVAARSTIERGSVIERDDLMVVRIELDPSLSTVPGDGLAGLVGQRAALDVAAGSLLTTGTVSAEVVPPAGHSLVGIGVDTSRMPGTSLLAGDQVRVVSTPDVTGLTTEAAQQAVEAVVVGIEQGTDATGIAQAILTLQVPAADAAGLAAMAATGNVAVVLDSRER